MSTLVHSRGEGVKIGQNLVHVVVECPLIGFLVWGFGRSIFFRVVAKFIHNPRESLYSLNGYNAQPVKSGHNLQFYENSDDF